MSQKSDAMKNVICVIVLSSICYLCINAQGPYCPKGWTYFKKASKCFRFVLKPFDVFDSRKTCRRGGFNSSQAGLVTFANEAASTVDFLKKMVKNPYIRFWIGINKNEEDEFFWDHSGEKITDFHWASGQPNSRESYGYGREGAYLFREFCFQMGNWKWYDAQCEHFSFPACEINVKLTDPCLVGNGRCGPAVCLTLVGKKYCVCPIGTVLKIIGGDIACAKEKFCSINNGGCSHGCHNASSTYNCYCPSGFALTEDFKTCKDINECEFLNGGCSQVCDNTEGSYSCSCVSGYLLVNNTYVCQAEAIVPAKLSSSYKLLPHLMGAVCTALVFAAWKFHFSVPISKENIDEPVKIDNNTESPTPDFSVPVSKENIDELVTTDNNTESPTPRLSEV